MTLTEQGQLIRRMKRAGVYRTASKLAKELRRKKLAAKFAKKAREIAS